MAFEISGSLVRIIHRRARLNCPLAMADIGHLRPIKILDIIKTLFIKRDMHDAQVTICNTNKQRCDGSEYVRLYVLF